MRFDSIRGGLGGFAVAIFDGVLDTVGTASVNGGHVAGPPCPLPLAGEGREGAGPSGP